MIAAQLAVTGHSQGCSPAQLASLREVLLELVRDGTWELHHADTLGSVQDAHAFWRACRQRVVIHPSTGTAGRALLDHDERRPALPSRERDIALAHETQALLVVLGDADTPDDHGTYRAARRLGRAIVLVFPSGHVQQWTHGLAPLEPDENASAPQE